MGRAACETWRASVPATGVTGMPGALMPPGASVPAPPQIGLHPLARANFNCPAPKPEGAPAQPAATTRAAQWCCTFLVKGKPECGIYASRAICAERAGVIYTVLSPPNRCVPEPVTGGARCPSRDR
jgi:hypothetical protein